MFDQLAKQLVTVGSRRADIWTDTEPKPDAVRNISIAIQMRNVKTGEILRFQMLSRARQHFDVSDTRIFTGLINNPTKVWRGYQAKLITDTTPWAEPNEELPNYAAGSVDGARVSYYVVTFHDTGKEHLCLGYKEASDLTGVTRGYLAKVICYGSQIKKINFTIRPATVEDCQRLKQSV